MKDECHENHSINCEIGNQSYLRRLNIVVFYIYIYLNRQLLAPKKHMARSQISKELGALLVFFVE